MAQYFEVLSHDNNVEQGGQFFNGAPENESTEIRYIFTDDSQQFPAQQLVHLSADQVMVVDGSQQQSQGVVIDQSQIAYQPANSQFGTVVQNANMHLNNQRQIYYMEATNAPAEAVQTVHAVIDQASAIQQNSQAPSQVQPLILDQRISPTNASLEEIRTIQATPRPILQVRTGIRPSPNTINIQPRSVLTTIRPAITPVRLQQPIQQMRAMTPQQAQMRLRPPTQQVRQATQIQQVRSGMNLQQKSQMVSMISRQLNALHNQKQQQSQGQAVQHPQGQIIQQEPEIQHPTDDSQITNDIQKNFTFQRQQLGIKNNKQDEIEDSMETSGPFPKVDCHPLIGKNPILARLPSNIKVTPTTAAHQQSSISQTINQVISQATQQQASVDPGLANVVNDASKRARASARSVRAPSAPPKARMQRASSNQGFNAVRAVGLQNQQQPSPRCAINQQPRFPNQQALISTRVAQQQQNIRELVPAPQQVLGQQNGSGESQINYLITPPTANRPRQQRPLPSYVASNQIQQIIESTPIAEEFSDSIRMLVLLENGEQRLITFTLPREACTIQEILEQVSVPFTGDTNIQVTEANTNGINYIVTVGNISNFGSNATEDESQDGPDTSTMPPMQAKPLFQEKTDQVAQINQDAPKAPSPEPPKELSKLIPGKLAVCSNCGYTGEDFNRCNRCHRKLPENVRSVDAPVKSPKHNTETPKDLTPQTTPVKSTTHQPASKPPPKKKSKPKPVEESVIISSDEEDDDKASMKSVNEQLLKNLGASVTISPVTKEPSLTEVKKHVRKLSTEPVKPVKLGLKCRTIRIGSYRFYPVEDVQIDSKCVVLKAPVVDNQSEVKIIRIDKGDIVKVLVCFNKTLPVIFYYLNVGAAPTIREILNMNKESGIYYDPIDEKDDCYRKITLLPENLIDDHKVIFQQVYNAAPNNIFDELTPKEANDILLKTSRKDGSNSSNFMSFSEIKQILLYPKEGQGRLNINTEDYVCLAVDQFLNDKIIDFYLKYLWENLDPEKQEKVHIFSTFFYKRLTTKPTKAARKSHPFEVDPTLTAAEKRHCRVKNWTKKINLFEKDFIVVPINENAHWFLAIICFPSMMGAQTFDGKPYNPEPKPKRVKKAIKEKPVPCDELMLSDKDEADSEDSDLESDGSEEFLPGTPTAASVTSSSTSPTVTTTTVAPPIPPVVTPPQPRGKKEVRPPIKQPCILIFDSLAGPSRSRVVATLRDYLTVEYKTKMESEKIFNRDVIKGASVKVPQQTNFTDCGLYLLQYVEQFFKDPIKDYYIPVKGISTWFEEITVTKKREDICNLIKDLMEEAGSDSKVLPDIALPTLNGKLVEKQPDADLDGEHETGEDGQEDMFTDIDDSEMLHTNVSSTENGETMMDNSQNASSDENSEDKLNSSQDKPSLKSDSEKSEISSTVMQLKPSLSEFPRQTNKDTLNYLKAKRIVRHKSSLDGPDLKKSKTDN